MDKQPAKRGFRLAYLLLFIPFAAALWTPFYNRVQPEFAGIPFFYWYQLLWIVLAAAILAAVHLSEGSGRS